MNNDNLGAIREAVRGFSPRANAATLFSAQEFLDRTKSFAPVRPLALLGDGNFLSIQASASHYCDPKVDTGPYSSVEVGYPSDPGGLEGYAVQWDEYVFPFVPIRVVDEIIRKHNGIVGAADIQFSGAATLVYFIEF